MKVDFGKVLAIGAHPDDVEFGAGGLLQLTSWTPTIFVLTSGEAGGDAVQRMAEARAAADVLKAELHTASFEDAKLGQRSTLEVVGTIERALLMHPFDTVITHHAGDTHQDHRTVYEATMSAVRRWRGTVLSYVTPTSRCFTPNFFVALPDDVFLQKVAAVQAHESQLQHPHLSPDNLAAMARYWGMMSTASEYAEPFVLVKHATELPSS